MSDPPEVKEEVNKGGRPVGSSTKISKLQRISTRLEQMARTQAMGIIQESLDGKVVEKSKLDTAKWTVTTAKQFHQAILQEKEAAKAKDKDDSDKEEIIVDEDESTGAAVFQLTRVQ